jgi:TolB-like protein/DNA-binding winged helix-turn-helix (wHTH) protein/tetratricopeptide (TPR) repeat protein
VSPDNALTEHDLPANLPARPAPAGSPPVRFGVYELDVRSGELRKGGTRIRLQEQPFQVLAALVERPGEVVTRDELRERLWPSGVIVDFDHSLNKAVNKLRDALGDAADNPRFIETLPKRGYRFLIPVTGSGTGDVGCRSSEVLGDTKSFHGMAPDIRPADPRISGTDHFWSTPRIFAGLAVVAMALAALALWKTWPAQASPPSGRIMLAVLPFRNLAGSPDEDYFSDGLTEEMITELGQLTSDDRLGVIARTSAMHYKNTSRLVTEIGRELGVDYILEGSIRRAARRVRITAQLVRIRDQTNLWSETYDRDLADVFAIQNDVASRIAGSLALELLPPQRTSRVAAHTTDIVAHEEYLKGRFLWSKRTEDGLRGSLDHFQRAVAADPGYARGYVGLADSYNLLADYGALAPADALPRARGAALRALEIDPRLAEAHASLAWTTLVYDRDLASAEQGFRRAIALNPGYASAHQWYAFCLKAAGRHDEAMREVRRAQELDPLSLIINAVVAWHHYYARQYDDAIAQARRVAARDPTFSRVYSYLGWSLLEKGEYAPALEALQKATDLFGNSPARRAEMAHALAVAGRTAEARRVLEEMTTLARTQYVESDLIARIHVGLGDRDRAFEWLERALAEHAPKLVLLRVDPRVDSLRSDPRFADLLRRAGLDNGRVTSTP